MSVEALVQEYHVNQPVVYNQRLTCSKYLHKKTADIHRMGISTLKSYRRQKRGVRESCWNWILLSSPYILEGAGGSSVHLCSVYFWHVSTLSKLRGVTFILPCHCLYCRGCPVHTACWNQIHVAQGMTLTGAQSHTPLNRVKSSCTLVQSKLGWSERYFLTKVQSVKREYLPTTRHWQL